MKAALEGSGTEDAPYFQKRMLRSKAGRRGGSNAFDDKVARAADPLAHDTKETAKNHAHLDQFLRDQILSQKSGRSKG